MSSITCCTMTQQVLWGYMPTVFCGGSDILGICCDPFRSWTKEPGKSEQMMEASLYACVYFYIISDLPVKGSQDFRKTLCVRLVLEASLVSIQEQTVDLKYGR